VERLEAVSRVEVLRASPPLFESKWLDRLTRVRPAVPAAVFGPVIVASLVLGAMRESGWTLVAGVAGGYLGWTLVEYWVHRSVFHLEPRSELGKRVHFVIHGVHHDHPNDPMRLVMPPVVSVPIGILFGLAFWLAFGIPDVFGVAVGFYGGYLAYDLIHFALHHRRPKSRLGRLLHQLHMRHHFEDHEHGFGVSAPWWDMVFGTATTRRRASRP
jgi:sterol desaturase/sphingolipid hydroxylase (fatty acid hydroxylase superfamily)